MSITDILKKRFGRKRKVHPDYIREAALFGYGVDEKGNFFPVKGRPDNVPVVDRKVVATVKPTWEGDQGSFSPINFQTMVKEGWRKNELIFACLNKTARTTSQVSLQLFKENEDEPIKEHPLAALLQKPNVNLTESDFWISVILYTQLAGKAVYEKERNNLGEVIRLWPLRPDWVRVLPGERGVLYEVPGMAPIPLKRSDVLIFLEYDPLENLHGWPRVAVAARSVDVDSDVTNFLKLFFEKGGAPPGVLKTVQKLNDIQVADIRRRWSERYGGYESWMEPAVLDKDAEYQRIGLTFNEMGFEVLDARNEARICQVMDVPPIIVGAKIGLDRATYANYKEARSAWWQDSLLPLYASFLDVIQNQLAVDFSMEGMELVWDLSRVPAIQEEQAAQRKSALEALLGGGITLNEYRAEVGKPDLGKFGEVLFVPNKVQAVPLADEWPVAKPAVKPVEEGEPNEEEPVDEEPVDADEEPVEEDTEKHWVDFSQLHKKLLDDYPELERRTALEQSLAQDLEGFFERQRQFLEERLVNDGHR